MEVIHRKGISITLAVEPDIPQEKRIYDFRVTFQVSIEIENKTVVQRSLHTHFMKTFSKTMVVFNGVSVGLENIFVPVNLTGGIGSSLQQKIIVTVDTGNQLLPSSFVFSVFINTIFFPFAREVAEGSITWK